MAACGNDFLVPDDFEVVNGRADVDMLKSDTEMLSEVNLLSKTCYQRRNPDNITVIFAPKCAFQSQDC